MSEDKLPSVNLSPGGAVSSTHFNIASANSVEYNVYNEFKRRIEHSIVDWVVTIPTFTDSEFEGGYNATNALEVTINAGDASKIDIAPGVAYIGGRRYKQVSTNTGYNLTGSSDATYLIRLKFQLSTNAFTFMVETGSGSSDSATVKYLTLASGIWDQTTTQTWTSMTDKRSTNTSLPAPITFTGSITGTILTIEQGGTGHALKVIGNATGGDVQFFDTTNPRITKFYGTSSTGITVYDNTTNSVVLSCDNSGRLLITSSLNVATANLGSVIVSGTTVQGFNTLTFDSTATIGATSATAIAFSGLNFTGVGTIGSGAITSTGAISATQYTSTIPIGTAPLVVTSTTKVTNLHADSVDGYGFSGATGTVTSSAAELNTLDGFTGNVNDFNLIKDTGRSQGDILYASGANVLGWLAASNGILNSSSGVVSWTLTPTLTSMTVGASGITFDGGVTDPVISAGDAALYFGDTVTLSDKASTPSWSITGAGVADFNATTVTTLGASTSVNVTSGPSLTSSGISSAQAIAGVTTINGTGAWATTSTIDFSGILSGATKTELNDAAYASGRALGDIRYANALNTLGWLTVGTDGHYLRVVSGLPTWQAFPSYDNYGSWNLRANTDASEVIGTGETVSIAEGTGIDVARVDNTITVTNSAPNSWRDIDTSPTTSAVKSISSSWANNHSGTGSTDLHTKLGTITQGTWQGTDIDSTYLDSTPSFATMTLSTLPSTVAGVVNLGRNDVSSVYGLNVRLSNGYDFMIKYISGGIELDTSTGESLTIKPASTLNLYTGSGVINMNASVIRIGDNTNIIPDTTDLLCDIGTSANYFDNIYCNYLRYKTGVVTFDHLDDLSIIESIRPSKIEKHPESGLAMADLSGLPDEIHDKEFGFINAGNMNTLLAGGIKQLHEKFKIQEELIEHLFEKIDDLEKKYSVAS